MGSTSLENTCCISKARLCFLGSGGGPPHAQSSHNVKRLPNNHINVHLEGFITVLHLYPLELNPHQGFLVWGGVSYGYPLHARMCASYWWR